MKNSQKDTCLDRFEKEWRNKENSIRDLAKVLDLHLKYVKKLHSLTPEWRKTFGARVEALEKEIPNLGLKDFEKVSKVIADARRALKQVKVEYGTGFQRQPTRAERRKILQLKPPAFANGNLRAQPETGDDARDLVDLYLGDLDSDDDDE
jgi:hypothetical protein